MLALVALVTMGLVGLAIYALAIIAHRLAGIEAQIHYHNLREDGKIARAHAANKARERARLSSGG